MIELQEKENEARKLMAPLAFSSISDLNRLKLNRKRSELEYIYIIQDCF